VKTLRTVLIVAFFVFLALLLISYFIGEKLAPPPPPEEKPAPAYKTVNLFFADESGKGLSAERRRIKKTLPDEEIKETLSALISGPEGALTQTIPPGTRLISVKVKDAIAYVNLSEEASSNHPGGSRSELLTIYSIVNTVALNFPQARKVQLLIEGETVETLAGHILISIPLLPDGKMAIPRGPS
jgi:spore germination protein GerM